MRLNRWEQHRLDEETSASIESRARDLDRQVTPIAPITVKEACERIGADVSDTVAEWRSQDYYNLRPSVASAIWYLRNATKAGQHWTWAEHDTAMALKILEAAMNRVPE